MPIKHSGKKVHTIETNINWKRTIIISRTIEVMLMLSMMQRARQIDGNDNDNQNQNQNDNNNNNRSSRSNHGNTHTAACRCSCIPSNICDIEIGRFDFNKFVVCLRIFHSFVLWSIFHGMRARFFLSSGRLFHFIILIIIAFVIERIPISMLFTLNDCKSSDLS